MIRQLLTAMLIATASLWAVAEAYVTSGEGVRYTIPALAEIAESGVVSEGDGVFTLTCDVTVSQGNTFSIEGVKVLKIADDVTLTLECYADMSVADGRALITRASDEDAPRGVDISYNSESDEVLEVKNIDFEYVALKNTAIHGLDITGCTFSYANGKMSSVGAVTLGYDGASFNITDCTFKDCTVPAIGCPANYACGVNIENCTFINNNTSNTNKPQLNLTVGGNHPIVIRNCKLEGDGLNMVGGIAVSNLLMLGGDNFVEISGCSINEHRYGITGIGPMNMLITNNTLYNNNHEDNPMNGGSGISLAGYGYGLDAIISGNHIENSLWGITLIYCRDVNIGQIDNPDSPGNNVFVNNGNNGKPYDLYNNQPNAVYAQNNTWSVPEQTAELIETVIYHAADDASLGEVIYMPAHESGGISDASFTDGKIAMSGERLISASPITITTASGTIVIDAQYNPDTSSLVPGIYIATTPSHTIKFVKR